MRNNLTLFLLAIAIGSTGFAQPMAGDAPCTATPLSVNTVCGFSPFTSIGSTVSGITPNPTCGSFNAGTSEDVWFTFTVPASGAVAITTQNGTRDFAMQLLSAPVCGGPLTNVECDDDDGPGNMPQITRSGLTPGATMYVRIWDFNDGTGNFEICVAEQHFDCSAFRPLCTGTAFNANSYGAGSTGEDLPCATGSEAQSTWMKFQIATGGTFTFTITPQNGTDDYDWVLYSSSSFATCSGGAQVSCNARSSLGPGGSTGLSAAGTSNNEGSGPGNPFNLILNVVAGQIYNLQVNNFSASSSGFNIAFGGTATLDCSPLAIEDLTFSAKPDADAVLLHWEINQHSDVNGFRIQRFEGSEWTSVGEMDRLSNQDVFDFSDNTPLPGMNQYRIMLETAGGAVSYSEVVEVVFDPAHKLHVYPNPAVDYLTIEAGGGLLEHITVLNLAGNEVLNINASGTLVTLPMDALPQGLYFVKCFLDGTLITRKFEVAR